MPRPSRALLALRPRRPTRKPPSASRKPPRCAREYMRDTEIKLSRLFCGGAGSQRAHAQAGPLAEARASQEVIEQQTALAERGRAVDGEATRVASTATGRRGGLPAADACRSQPRHDQARDRGRSVQATRVAEANRDTTKLNVEAEANRRRAIADAEADATKSQAIGAAEAHKSQADAEAYAQRAVASAEARR